MNKLINMLALAALIAMPAMAQEKVNISIATGGTGGVSTGTCGHRDQAIRTLFNRLVGKFVVDDVMQHHAAIAVRGLVDFLARPQRSDDHRHFVLHTQSHVVL